MAPSFDIVPRRLLGLTASVLLLFLTLGADWARDAGGDLLWEARYGRPPTQRGRAMVVSPDGSRVYVAGTVYTAGFEIIGYGTGAFDANTGARIWGAREGVHFEVSLNAIAVSPDGSKVFVTGHIRSNTSNPDWGTVAYDAATGNRLWRKTYDGPAFSYDKATAVAVSPDGSAVFVTGDSWDNTTGADYTTLAYRATDGATLWEARYDNAQGPDRALAVAVAGSRVLVTGDAWTGSNSVGATLAYDAASGTELWQESTALGTGSAITVNPSDSTVFVTGYSQVAAYAISDGMVLWSKTSSDVLDTFRSIVVSPDGSRVYVAGSRVSPTLWDYVTVAYGAANGTQFWVSTYSGPGNDNDTGIAAAIRPDGSEVYVTGYSRGPNSGLDYATIAYKSSTGSQAWEARYNGPGNADDAANAIAASPDGSKVFVVGTSIGATTGMDLVAVAYEA
jgi:putative pyrroloquinoline-quinone binding quinoprotein